MAPSEMVVISEFHEPSSELAWAASGSAARSSWSASFWSRATVAGGRADADGAQVVLDGAVHMDAGLLGQSLAALVATGAQPHHGAADGERRRQGPTSPGAAGPPHVRRASARPIRAGSG